MKTKHSPNISELSEEAIKIIDKAKNKIKSGQFLSESEARKRLGLITCN